MRRIVIPIFILFSMSFGLDAQHFSTMQPNPDAVDDIRPGDPTTPRSGADAGTAIQTLFASAQSTDPLFLCLGDSMNITHLGGSLLGDPNVLTAPGFTYVFYSCTPTIDGPNWATILTDPCHIIDPNTFVPPGITTVQTLIDPLGNATFFNDGSIPSVFGGGGPYEVFFAPITVDDFANFDPEPDPGTNELGPCMDVNTAATFSVTYLNGIQGANFTDSGCFGSLNLTGGLPEWDGSVYDVSIVNNADPTITGNKTNTTALTHGTDLTFAVPVPGMYTVTVSDDVSCAFSIVLNMGNCNPPVLNIGDNTAMSGDNNVCVEVTVDNFVDILSLDFSLMFDPAVLTFNNIVFENPFSFALPFSPQAGVVSVTWGNNSPLTHPNGTLLMSICFDVIGAAGTDSAIEIATGFNDPAYGSSLGDNALMIEPGNIAVLGGPITLDFTTCSTQNTANPTGTMTMTASGGSPGYNYTYVLTTDLTVTGAGTIPNNGGSVTITNLPPGTYSVTVSDAIPTIETQFVIVADAPTLTPILAGTGPTCQGDTNGSMLLNQGNFTNIGGVAPYTIDWSTGAADMNQVLISGLIPGVYMATVTDGNGCSQVASQGIVDPPLLTIDVTNLTQISCTGNGMDGSITVDAVGGIGPMYNYAWNNGANTPTNGPLGPGMHCVTIIDQNGCQVDQCFTLSVSTPPTLSFMTTPLACPGDMSGSATVNIVPGSGTVTSIMWETGGNMETINNLGEGTYTVTVMDDTGCEVIDSVTLIEPMGLEIANVTVTPSSCIPTADAQISVQAAGGTGNYSFSWSSGGNQSTEFNLACGESYIVVISDGGNCPPVSDTIFIPCPAAVTADFQSIVGVDCNGAIPCDGSATVIPSGGTSTGVYFYEWDNGTSQMSLAQSTVNDLCQGINTVSIYDGNNCEFVFTIDIPAPPVLTLDPATTQITQVSCNGESDGSITASGQGGVGPYSYTWLGGPSTDTYSGLSQGDYFLTIADQNLCEFSVTIPMPEPDPLVPFIVLDNTTDPSCSGELDGVIEVAWTGGNLGTTTFMWSGSSSTSNIAGGLGAGIYSVTVTDVNGCTGVLDTLLNEPPPIVFATPDIIEPECNGETGLVTLTSVSGGTGTDYSFSVDMSTRRPITQPILVLAGDNVPVTVFDENDCSATQFITINEPDALIVEFGVDAIPIDLGETELLDPYIESALGIDSLIWTPMTTIACQDTLLNLIDCEEVNVNPFESTLYTLTVIDPNGCSATDEVLLSVSKKRNVYIPNAFSPDDNGRNDFFQIFLGNGIKSIPSVTVFDRWGEVILVQQDVDISIPDPILWDGYVKGKLMNPGVFVYLIEVEFLDDEVFLYRGDLTLIR